MAPENSLQQVLNFQHEIKQRIIIKKGMTDADKVATLRLLCTLATRMTMWADQTAKMELRKDTIFTETCWHVYKAIFEDLTGRGRTLLRLTFHEFNLLDQIRDGCFVGFFDFLLAYHKEVSSRCVRRTSVVTEEEDEASEEEDEVSEDDDESSENEDEESEEPEEMSEDEDVMMGDVHYEEQV